LELIGRALAFGHTSLCALLSSKKSAFFFGRNELGAGGESCGKTEEDNA
jgi:hypothetical protein